MNLFRPQNSPSCAQKLPLHSLPSKVYSNLVITGHILQVSIRFVQQHKGTAVAQWLRCCATNRKVAGSIPDGATGIFH